MSQGATPGSRTGRGSPVPVQQQGRIADSAAQPNLLRGNLAALDLGTNNCRLLIARPEARASSSSTLSRASSAWARALPPMAACPMPPSSGPSRRSPSARTSCAAAACVLARSVATEACRQAANGAEFVQRVHDETGIMLDIISAREEARLAVLGCQSLLEPGDGPPRSSSISAAARPSWRCSATKTDMSASSTGRARPGASSSLTEAVGTHDDTLEGRTAAYAAMRETMRKAFAAFAARTADGRRGAAARHLRHGDDAGDRVSRPAAL